MSTLTLVYASQGGQDFRFPGFAIEAAALQPR